MIETALVLARRVTPVIMVVVFIAAAIISQDFPVYGNLQEAIAAQHSSVFSSALLQQLSGLSATFSGSKIYALGQLSSSKVWLVLILISLGNAVIYYNLCAVLSAFIIPRTEYRRVFGPLTEAAEPATVAKNRIAMTTGVITFITLFIYLPLGAYAEAWVQESSTVSRIHAKLEQKVEQIDDAYFRDGTLQQIQQARLEALAKVDLSLEQLEAQSNVAFDKIAGNVDIYLDWYYSLVGEYTRIGKLLVGDLETYMAAKLEEMLKQDDAFREVEAALNQALTTHAEAMAVYEETVHQIMAENRMGDDQSALTVAKQLSIADVLSPPVHQDMLTLQNRLLLSGGSTAIAGVVTAAVVGKIVAKVVSKNVVKIAAKALAKVAASKAVSAAGGASAGAALGAATGSVVPGIGTAIGAVIGGLVGGIATGVAVDSLLIALEESVNREDFKAEILASIEDARKEFNTGL